MALDQKFMHHFCSRFDEIHSVRQVDRVTDTLRDDVPLCIDACDASASRGMNWKC